MIQVAGGSLSSVSSDAAALAEWSDAVKRGVRTSFEQRVVLGLGIARGRPAHGELAAYHAQLAETLGWSSKWVREAERIAGVVKEAVDDGVALPLGLRDVAWKLVPIAVANIRAGRPLDWRPPLPDGPSAAEAVEKALVKLEDALAKVENGAERARLRDRAVARLQAAGTRERGDGVDGPGDGAGAGLGDGARTVPAAGDGGTGRVPERETGRPGRNGNRGRGSGRGGRGRGRRGGRGG